LTGGAESVAVVLEERSIEDASGVEVAIAGKLGFGFVF